MSSEEEGGSRSDRLRRRRQQSSQSAKSEQTDETSEPPEKSESSKPSETADESGGESVKDEQVGTYMYLPESQKKELDRLYNVCKAEYEFEFDDEFQKNRHFFPLVVQHGLDGLDGLDASEIKDRLESL